MMKKIFLALVSIFVLLALCGCTTAFINAPDRDLNKNMIVIASKMPHTSEAPTAVPTAAQTFFVATATPLPTIALQATDALKTQEIKTDAPKTAIPTQTPYVNDGTVKYVALTFDDGPSSRATGRILDVLDAYDSKATFFVVGKSNPPNDDSEALKKTRWDLMNRAVRLGCEIGNHTMEHKHLPDLSVDEMTYQVEGVVDIVKQATGTSCNLVRPPYGDKSQLVYDTVKYPLILWSIDTLDWKTRNAESTYKEVMDKVRDGDIVLMHDIYATTADAVEMIVPELINRGFKLVTVSELFRIKGIELEAGKFNRKAY
ncbi:MAG: polysaccharide deacetylase family protein [Clostridia bacterium]|nr:polysaccharide deacetylase family protein [Clostridia bacterium]